MARTGYNGYRKLNLVDERIHRLQPSHAFLKRKKSKLTFMKKIFERIPLHHPVLVVSRLTRRCPPSDLTHLPTGITVSIQDEKSQIKNKEKAMKVLRARVSDKFTREIQDEYDEKRKSAVGTGDRSERIRTYNFPQNRVTDHRIGLTIQKLDQIIEGKLDEVIDALIMEEQAFRLESLDRND